MDNDDDDDIRLVSLEVKTTEALAQRLRANTGSLESVLTSAAEIEVVPPSASGLKAVDPLTLSILLAVAAKSATGAVAALVAKEIYTWIRQMGTDHMKEDGPSEVMLTIGTGQGIAVSISGSAEDVQSAEKKIKEALVRSGFSPDSRS